MTAAANGCLTAYIWASAHLRPKGAKEFGDAMNNPDKPLFFIIAVQ